MRFSRFWALGVTGAVLAAAACSSANAPDTGLGNSTDTGAGGTKGTAGTKGASGHGATSGATGFPVGAGGTSTGHGGGGLNIDGGTPTMTNDCPSMPDVDQDKDGWTAAEGDCNDCNANVNPGAIDVFQTDMSGNPLPPEMQVDSNCDGLKPASATNVTCDDNIPVGGVADPFDAAKAMGLCNTNVQGAPTDPKQRVWGVTRAALSSIAGAPFSAPPPSWAHSGADTGILDGFGAATHPQEGSRVFSLSSGVARTPGQPGFLNFNCETVESGKNVSIDKGYPGALSMDYPDGFPKQSSCGMTGGAHDGVALDLEIRVPTNANAMSFDFRFFTCEYPEYVCASFNDILAVFMAPDPLPPGDPMGDATDSAADIAFESSSGMKNTIGVNNTTFLTACDASNKAKQYTACKGGGDLAGTNFEGHAGSAWLRSQVPVPPGQTIVLRIAIWDSGDGLLDSSAVVDNFRWIADPGANSGTSTMIIGDPH